MRLDYVLKPHANFGLNRIKTVGMYKVYIGLQTSDIRHQNPNSSLSMYYGMKSIRRFWRNLLNGSIVQVVDLSATTCPWYCPYCTMSCYTENHLWWRHFHCYLQLFRADKTFLANGLWITMLSIMLVDNILIIYMYFNIIIADCAYSSWFDAHELNVNMCYDVTDVLGQSSKCQQSCNHALYRPVCASDGRTYGKLITIFDFLSWTSGHCRHLFLKCQLWDKIYILK
jgi:hypothetical protein